MSDEMSEYLPYEEAIKIVAAIQEEEDINQKNRRILTVYNQDDKEICWFDYDETIAAVGDVPDGERKVSVQNYILNRIPRWVLDI